MVARWTGRSGGAGRLLLLLTLAHAGAGAFQEARAQRPPAWEEETLRYRILWPSGMTLGEAVFQVSASEDAWRFRLTVEANLPQYDLSDSFFSVATRGELCSLSFRREIEEGRRVWEETIAFDRENREARRTRDSRTTVATVPECARDPLTFLYFFRSQLAAGKTVSTGSFHLGSNFDLQIQAAGTESIAVDGEPRQAGKYRVTYSGPETSKTFELWISADAARQPLRARVPFPLAVFSAELR